MDAEEQFTEESTEEYTAERFHDDFKRQMKHGGQTETLMYVMFNDGEVNLKVIGADINENGGSIYLTVDTGELEVIIE